MRDWAILIFCIVLSVAYEQMELVKCLATEDIFLLSIFIFSVKTWMALPQHVYEFEYGDMIRMYAAPLTGWFMRSHEWLTN